MEGLAAKGLVEEKGRSEAVGRPILYGTTDEFLKHFGFSSIKELPEINDLEGVLASGDDEYEDDGSEQMKFPEVNDEHV